MDWVACMGTEAALIRDVVTIPPAIDVMGGRQRKTPQEVLNALLNLTLRRIGVAGVQSDEDDVDYIEGNGLDVGR